MKSISILGCGDFLRWQSHALSASKSISVRYLYDPQQDRAGRFAEALGGRVAPDPSTVLEDPETDIVALFVPPWIRKDFFMRALEAGKAVLCTKPLASTVAEAQEMVQRQQDSGALAGVIYNRTESRAVETLKKLLSSERFGRLALFRQDWLHGYPKWNTWALDPAKNGGPFMDAMIHNLNICRYLMGRPMTGFQWVSRRLAHPDLPCADTEALTATFEGGLAHLFITWAADLATYSTAGNDREHIDLFYLVTDHGWRLTLDACAENDAVLATREGKREIIPFEFFAETHYDAFARAIEEGSSLPARFASIEEAAEDIRIIRDAAANERFEPL